LCRPDVWGKQLLAEHTTLCTPLLSAGCRAGSGRRYLLWWVVWHSIMPWRWLPPALSYRCFPCHAMMWHRLDPGQGLAIKLL
jgi:hypothetical protein